MKQLRRFCLSLLLLLLLLCCIGTVMAEEETNLLANADFSLLDEDELPLYWYTDAYVQEAGYSVFTVTEDPTAPGGGNVITVENMALNDARFAQEVEVEPESLYRFSGYIKAEDITEGRGANLSIEGLYVFSSSVYDTDGEWQYIEWYGETGPDQDLVTLFARVGGYSGESMGKASFTLLQLCQVDEVPGDGIADRWYSINTVVYAADDDEDYEEDETPQAAWPYLLVIAAAYVLLGLGLVRFLYSRKALVGEAQRFPVAACLLLALVFRLVLSTLVEGYSVDVNCFLSWGSTMRSYGSTGFYAHTSFCDYPPVYMWVLGLNASLVQILGSTSEGMQRLIFRLIPNLCDLAACGLLMKWQAGKNKPEAGNAAWILLLLWAFNPFTILNSAAWGQIDSVLCLLLLLVAVLAAEGCWQAALPCYVLSVLTKPQGLVLGFLGVTAVVIAWIKQKEDRKKILWGLAFSALTALVVILPFGILQEPGWLVGLYKSTLSSYDYATINTANFWYLLGGNWKNNTYAAPALSGVLLCLLSLLYGGACLMKAKQQKQKLPLPELLGTGLFALFFIVCAFASASWKLVGTGAMVASMVLVLGLYIRKKDVRFLPFCGGLLFLLLYVFGLKMHERYLAPALILFLTAWVLQRDRRLLWLTLLLSATVFVNEGVILDNSIRLGSMLGHLNSDNIGLASVLAGVNLLCALLGLWTGLDLQADHVLSVPTVPVGRRLLPSGKPKTARSLLTWHPDAKLHWHKKDTILLSVVMLVYALVSFTTLGSTKAPQTAWTSTSYDECVTLDLGAQQDDFTMLYFARVSRYDFSVQVSEDGENWSEETWAQMDQGQCWKWKYVTSSTDAGNGTRNYASGSESAKVHFSGRYVKITAHQVGLALCEVLFRDSNGQTLPVSVLVRENANEDSELYADPSALVDEQDTLEGMPNVFSGETTTAEPSWWNSTYFDEIYHARTAYEFLNASTPYETSHPPLGKVLMSWGVALFGMTPFGWRFAGALAGLLMLPGMYLLGKQLTKRTCFGLLPCLLMALDCMHLTQTQIATIDSFPVLFIIFAFFFMLRFMQRNIMTDKLSAILTDLALCGLSMGLAIASKWIGIYAGAGLALLYFGHCGRFLRFRSQAEKLLKEAKLTAEERKQAEVYCCSGKKDPVWRRFMLLCLCCVGFFVVVPVGIYLLSYIPYLAYNTRIHSFGAYLEAVINAQVSMFNYHSTPGLGMDHPFYSPWYEWPVIGKPMFYATKQYLTDANYCTSIFCFGNPVIWLPALGTMLYCALKWVFSHRYALQDGTGMWHMDPPHFDKSLVFLLIGILAQYLPWVLVPRGTYIYHYFASTPFLMLSITLAFRDFSARFKKAGMLMMIVYLVLAAGAFVLFWPYASGMMSPVSWLELGKKFLSIWY